jgi:hypothetical protein
MLEPARLLVRQLLELSGAGKGGVYGVYTEWDSKTDATDATDGAIGIRPFRWRGRGGEESWGRRRGELPFFFFEAQSSKRSLLAQRVSTRVQVPPRSVASTMMLARSSKDDQMDADIFRVVTQLISSAAAIAPAGRYQLRRPCLSSQGQATVVARRQTAPALAVPGGNQYPLQPFAGAPWRAASAAAGSLQCQSRPRLVISRHSTQDGHVVEARRDQPRTLDRGQAINSAAGRSAPS